MSYLATVYGANIVVCDSTREVIKEYYHIREVDVVTRRDIKENITISEVMSISGSEHNHDMMSVNFANVDGNLLRTGTTGI